MLENRATKSVRDLAQSELILGHGELLPFAFLRQGDRIGRAVVKIDRGDGAAGTGFVVAPRVLLTNHHVLPNPEMAAKARAFANFEPEPPSDAAGRAAIVALDPEALFITNPDLDFTFCGVAEGLEHVGVVTLERDSMNIIPSEHVNIIQHPGGRFKEVAIQDSRVVKVDNVVVHYCCDTEPGSSGSPVFNSQWRLVAMHHASVVTENPRGRQAVGGASGTCYLNEGVRLSAIALWLESAEANTPDLRRQSSRLRALFHDLDYQVGFFGALGHRVAGRMANQFVADTYQGAAPDLDIGYWDLSTFGRRFFEHREELGWAVAGMGMDIWCLSHVDTEGLELLCDSLESRFQLNYHILRQARSTDSSNAVSLLVRANRNVDVRWIQSTTDDGLDCVIVHVLTGRGSSSSLLIVPIPADMGSHPERMETVFQNRPESIPSDLLLLGDGLAARDLHALLRVGNDHRAAFGQRGGFVLIPRPGSYLRTSFASPNLDQTLGAAQSLVVSYERRWPQAIERLGLNHPIALRLIFDRE